MKEAAANGDAGLCEALAADLDGAFERLVLAYQDRLYGFALRLTASPRDAEEIAQDAFVRAYRALGGYPAEQVRTLALKPWLYRIALNVCRNRLRGKRPVPLSLEMAMESRNGEASEVAELPDERLETPEVVFERVETGEELARAVAALPERYRTAVVLRFVQDLSYAEVSAVLGQPVGTAKANVHRGMKLLRNRLAEMEQREQQNWRTADEER